VSEHNKCQFVEFVKLLRSFVIGMLCTFYNMAMTADLIIDLEILMA
jgi:hypothetical protein